VVDLMAGRDLCPDPGLALGDYGEENTDHPWGTSERASNKPDTKPLQCAPRLISVLQ
jgi:hypothetical protein